MKFEHPTRGGPLTELEQVLWRFRMSAHEAQVMIRGFLAYPDVSTAVNDDLLFGLSNQGLLIVAKFLEIWDDSGRLTKSEHQMLGLRRALKPLIDRIRVWKGLRELRNTSLAHAYLDENNQLTGPWELISDAKAPSYHAEIILLLYLVHIAVLCILFVFQEVYLPIDELAGPPRESKTPPVGPGIELGTQLRPAMDAIAEQIGPRVAKECGVTIRGPFAEQYHATIKPRAV